jgi:hypothetical protein
MDGLNKQNNACLEITRKSWDRRQTTMKNQTQKFETIESICPDCAGKMVIPHRHISNKRNSKPCPTCKVNSVNTGMIEKVVPIN